MTVRSLIIGGIPVPLHAMLEIDQTYTPLQASSRRRTRDGSAKQRTVWRGKLATTISGRGSIPAGIQGLDYGGTLTLACVQHMAISSASNEITLPSARRSDAGSTPYGRAMVMAGNTPQWVDTPLALAGDVATLTAVTGATQYQVVYFPLLTVFADPPRQTKGGHGPDFGWELTAEEV